MLVASLQIKAVATFTVNEEQLELALGRNPILVTALNPVIGYLKAAEIAKKAYKEGRAVVDVAEEETDIPRAELEKTVRPGKNSLRVVWVKPLKNHIRIH